MEKLKFFEKLKEGKADKLEFVYDLNHSDFKNLSEELKKNKSLKNLVLWDNDLGSNGCQYLSEALKINNSLQKLILRDNNIGSNGCKYLSEALKLNNSLQKLDLEYNKIGDEGCKYLSEALKVNNTLKVLKLDKNNIKNEGCKYLSEALKINNSLYKLNLNWNEIGNEGWKYLSEALKLNYSLQSLYVESYNIGEKVIEVLSEALKLNISLQNLFLKNNLNKEMKSKLKLNRKNTIHIENKKEIDWKEIDSRQLHLKILILEACSLKELKIKLDNFKKLIVLDLRNNELTNVFIKPLCYFIKWNSSLKILKLQGNKSLGDNEGREILDVLPFNIHLIECNLKDTSISHDICDKIKNQLNANFLFGKTSLHNYFLKYINILKLINSNKFGEVKEELSKNINNIQYLQEVLFICCVWNLFELCEFILNQNINVNFKLDGNTYLHLSVMKDNDKISKLLVEKGIDINLKNNETKTCRDLCISNGKCLSLFEDMKLLKVVILGKAEVGKTTLVKKILKLEENILNKVYTFYIRDPDLRTDGIEMHEWSTGSNNNIQLWDFGGQELFYTTHQFFLSKNSIHLLLFNLTDEYMEKELYFWLNSIQYRAPKSKVIIIGSHMDKIDPNLMKDKIKKASNKIKNIYDKIVSNIAKNSNDNNDDIIEIIPCLYWENPKLNKTYSNEKIWCYPISGIFGWNIKYLEEIIRKFSFNTIVRKEFIELKNQIIFSRDQRINSGRNPILLREELSSIILECFNNRNEEIERNIKLLHELGFILDFGNNYKYIIIHPQWLSYVFKSVISLKNTDQIKDGTIQLNEVIKNLNDLPRLCLQDKHKSNSVLDLINTSLHDDRKEKIEKILSRSEAQFKEEYKSQYEFLIELLEEFNIIVPHPNDLTKMRDLKKSNEKDKYLNSNILMIILCSLCAEKPIDIETQIFNLKISENNKKEILGRKYYFSFIPRGIYEVLSHKIYNSIGSTMRFWKNGLIATSKDTYLTMEITENQNNVFIFAKSIGSLSTNFISLFHYIIEDFFKDEFFVLWNNVNIEIYFKKLNQFNNTKEDELHLKYNDCLEKFKGNQKISYHNQYDIPFEFLLPEKFEKRDFNDVELKNLKIDSSQISAQKKIKSGTISEVFTCKDLRTRAMYVMKKFKINSKFTFEENSKTKKVFERELQIMKQLKHPNLVKLIGYEDVNDLNIFMEFFDYSLHDLQEEWLERLPSYLQQETQRDPLHDKIRKVEEYWWKEEEIIFISLQILNGLEYLHHRLFISHLDLKAENILIDLKESFDYKAKRPSLLSIHITDFGTSRQFLGLNSTFNERVGSREHMAPEVKMNLTSTQYSPFKADVYSLGVLFCEIIGNNTSLKNELDKLKGKTELEEIICNCLEQDPTKRNDISKILEKMKAF